MKPCITPRNKKKAHFCLQFDGLDEKSLIVGLTNYDINAYSTPPNQAINNVWYFDLLTAQGVYSFTASSTQVNGWEEYGSLAIKYSKEALTVRPDFMRDVLIKPPFRASKIQKIIYEDDDVITECGLLLSSTDSTKIIIACGISPESITADGIMFTGDFQPLYPTAMCNFVDL